MRVSLCACCTCGGQKTRRLAHVRVRSLYHHAAPGTELRSSTFVVGTFLCWSISLLPISWPFPKPLGVAYLLWATGLCSNYTAIFSWARPIRIKASLGGLNQDARRIGVTALWMNWLFLAVISPMAYSHLLQIWDLSSAVQHYLIIYWAQLPLCIWGVLITSPSYVWKQSQSQNTCISQTGALLIVF